MKEYYLPIQSTSLAHYFGNAIIKPAKYYNNKPHDIQDKCRDFLLFTDKIGTTETDCCLEVVLTEDESKKLIDIQGGWFLYDKPLPITRIKKILFADIAQKEITISNIRLSTAYVPDSLVDIKVFENNPSNFIKYPTNCGIKDCTSNLNKFDKCLGALALMKTAGDSYMNYSENYIATLSFFNLLIKKQINNVNKEFRDSYQGIFYNSKGFEKILPYLNNSIDEQCLYEIASQNKQEIKKDKITRIINLDSISDTWTYTIAVLNTYGVGDESKKKRIDGQITSHFSELKKGKAEGVALCYGYNRGYSAFAKDYGFDNKVSYKYKMESQLDYYTIESVYQYVFNAVISSNFDYLDIWCPKKQNNLSISKTDYMILDEVIIGKKKIRKSWDELWNGIVQSIKERFPKSSDPFTKFFLSSIKEEIMAVIKEEQEENNSLWVKLNEKEKVIDNLKAELVQKTNEIAKITQKQSIFKDEFVSIPRFAEPEVKFGDELNEKNLNKKKKDELIRLAKEQGFNVPKNTNKKDIIELILKQNLSQQPKLNL